jgi:hypothetical protein
VQGVKRTVLPARGHMNGNQLRDVVRCERLSARRFLHGRASPARATNSRASLPQELRARGFPCAWSLRAISAERRDPCAVVSCAGVTCAGLPAGESPALGLLRRHYFRGGYLRCVHLRGCPCAMDQLLLSPARWG